VSGDGRTLVTGGQDNAARVWGLPLAAPRAKFSAHAVSATAMALLADGRTAVTAGPAPGIRLWRLEQPWAAGDGAAPDKPPERSTDPAPVVVIAAAADTANFTTADAVGHIVLWSPLLDEPLGAVGMQIGGVTALALPAGGQRLFSAGAYGTLRTWSLPPQPVKRSAPRSAVRDLATVPGQQLAVVAAADAVSVVSAESLEVVREFERPTDLPPLNEATSGARILSGRNQGRAGNATRKSGAGGGHHPEAPRGGSRAG
jgi:WD40 repeat protein